jgi:hypothetical protein
VVPFRLRSSVARRRYLVPSPRCLRRSVVAVAAGVDARADVLLYGPRGRALCAAAAGLYAHRLLSALARPVSAVTLRSTEEANAGRPGWPPAGWAELSAGDAGTAPTVAEVASGHVAEVDLDALDSTEDPSMLLAVLAEAVNDWAFSDDDVRGPASPQSSLPPAGLELTRKSGPRYRSACHCAYAQRRDQHFHERPIPLSTKFLGRCSRPLIRCARDCIGQVARLWRPVASRFGGLRRNARSAHRAAYGAPYAAPYSIGVVRPHDLEDADSRSIRHLLRDHSCLQLVGDTGPATHRSPSRIGACRGVVCRRYGSMR